MCETVIGCGGRSGKRDNEIMELPAWLRLRKLLSNSPHTALRRMVSRQLVKNVPDASQARPRRRTAMTVQAPDSMAFRKTVYPNKQFAEGREAAMTKVTGRRS
jgi:hypothetical protein